MRSSTGRAVVAATGFFAVIAVIAGNFAVSYYLWFVSVPLLLWLTFLVFHSVRRAGPTGCRSSASSWPPGWWPGPS